MELKEIENKVAQVIELYAKRFNIRRDEDWFIIKIQEELGELSSAYLKLTQRARTNEKPRVDLQQNLEEEVADVVAMTLLFARAQNIDVEKAIQKKWLKYLPEERARVASLEHLEVSHDI